MSVFFTMIQPFNMERRQEQTSGNDSGMYLPF